MSSISQQVHAVRDAMTRCANRCGRDPADITLLAVSKTRSSDEIRQAAAAGCRHFGESYVQEAIGKIQSLTDPGLVWHFIGPIQSNKTRDIAQHFTWVHSIDREKIARRLNDQRPSHLPPLNVCIQVNISAEASKSGVLLEQVDTLASMIAALPRLRLRGLMAIPQRAAAGVDLRQPFKQLHDKFRHLNEQGMALDTLSMGMTNDLCPAILEGSTMVRVGTGIFGPRA